MAYAPEQTSTNFPHVVCSAGKRFLEDKDVADEFTTVITTSQAEAEDHFEPAHDEDWIDPTDSVAGDLSMETDDEPEYDPWVDDSMHSIEDDPLFYRHYEHCEDCGGPCAFDGYYYDPYDMSYLEDEETKCDIAGCNSEQNAPSIHCDEHGNVYSRYHEEIENRVEKLIDEHGEYDCVYRCAITQNMHCGYHGHLYDSRFHVDEDYHRECSEHNHLDDVEYVFNPNYYEENPEKAEYDFVETHWEFMLRRFYDDRCYDPKDKARHRHLINSLPRIKRRDGSIKLRGDRLDWEDKADHDRRAKLKNMYVE